MRWTALFLLGLLAPASALGWGFSGHRRLARHMQDALPSGSCLRQYIESLQSYDFQDASADPDRWRISSDPSFDPDEWYRHYLEVDWASPIESYPREWSAVQVQFHRYALRNGQVPWRIEEYQGRLIDAFRARDSARVRLTLAHYSHYVTDAFSVLHDTKHYDGNPANGLHSRWESDMLDTQARIDGITSLAAQYLGTVGRADPRNHAFDIVLVGNGLVPELIAADLTARDGGTFSMSAFYTSVRELTARRWGDALTLFGSLVATAWIDAGKPTLPGMVSGCSTDLPQGEVVLRGYPVPGGWWKPPPDAGSPPEDGGFGDGGGGAGGGGGGSGWQVDPEPVPEESCGGCSGPTAALVWPLLALGLVASRSRARRGS